MEAFHCPLRCDQLQGKGSDIHDRLGQGNHQEEEAHGKEKYPEDVPAQEKKDDSHQRDDVARSQWRQEAAELASGQRRRTDNHEGESPPVPLDGGCCEDVFLFVGKVESEGHDQEAVAVIGHHSPVAYHGFKDREVHDGHQTQDDQCLGGKDPPRVVKES